MRRCTIIHVLLFFVAVVAAAADADMPAIGAALVAAAAATATAFATAITAGLLGMFFGLAGPPNLINYNTKRLRLAKKGTTGSRTKHLLWLAFRAKLWNGRKSQLHQMELAAANVLLQRAKTARRVEAGNLL